MIRCCFSFAFRECGDSSIGRFFRVTVSPRWKVANQLSGVHRIIEVYPLPSVRLLCTCKKYVLRSSTLLRGCFVTKPRKREKSRDIKAGWKVGWNRNPGVNLRGRLLRLKGYRLIRWAARRVAGLKGDEPVSVKIFKGFETLLGRMDFIFEIVSPDLENFQKFSRVLKRVEVFEACRPRFWKVSRNLRRIFLLFRTR